MTRNNIITPITKLNMSLAILKEPVKLQVESQLVYHLRSPTEHDLGPDLEEILSMSEVGRKDIITTPVKFLKYVLNRARIQPLASVIFLIVQGSICIGYTGFSHIWTESGELSIRVHPSYTRRGIRTKAI